MKSFATHAVCGERVYLRNAFELYQFLNETLTVKSVECSRPMINRIFFFISLSDMEEYRDGLPGQTYEYIKGTLGIHHIVTKPGDETQILYRLVSCGCKPCLDGVYDACLNLNNFSDYPELLKMNTHLFKVKGLRKARKQGEGQSSEDQLGDLEEEEIEEFEKEEYMESDASKVIVCGDIAVIKTSDDHPYYLLMLTEDPYVTDCVVSDDYGHDIPPMHRVVEGHYLEVHKATNDGDIYFLDDSKTAIISSFSVVGNCPLPETVKMKRRRKEQDMYLINLDLHQGLCELVNCFDM